MVRTGEEESLLAGDRVALLVPGSPAYVDLVLALLADGVFPVPLDPALTEAERDRILEPIAPDLVVTSQEQVEQLLAARPGRSRSLPLGRPIHCTSGTTGTPKGVWSGLLPQQDATALVAEERDLWGFDADDVNLVLSPLHHSAPLRFAAGTLLAGGRIVVPGKFDPAAVTAAIERERPTTMFCVPTHLQRLFDHWDAVGVPDLSSFRLVAHAGAPCPPSVKRRLVELFPDGSTWEFYGSTEGQFTACRSEDWLRASRHGGPRPARPHPHHRRRRPHLVRRAAARPVHLPRCPRADGRRMAGHARRAGVHRRRRRTHRRRRLPPPRGPAHRPGHHRRGQRLPARGRERARARSPVSWTSPSSASPTPAGASGCAPRSSVTATTGCARAHAEQVLAPAKRPKDYLRVAELPMTATGKVRRDALTELV